jgi:hypothetical protein
VVRIERKGTGVIRREKRGRKHVGGLQDNGTASWAGRGGYFSNDRLDIGETSTCGSARLASPAGTYFLREGDDLDNIANHKTMILERLLLIETPDEDASETPRGMIDN